MVSSTVGRRVSPQTVLLSLDTAERLLERKPFDGLWLTAWWDWGASPAVLTALGHMASLEIAQW